jgi:penicillin-binding protein 1A
MAPRAQLGRLSRRANVITLVALLFACVGIGAFLGVYQRMRENLPSIARLENWQPSLITKVYSRDGEVIAEFASERREVIPLERVPQHFIRAILATEDRAFYKHDGINPRRVLSAAWNNLITGQPTGQGASTITMQLSRNLFLTPEKRFVRKFKEMILAQEIEHRYAKKRILEMYINQVYFGSGAYGIESAAQLYFNKPATQLTLPEAALLAGIVQAPSRQSPRVSMDAAQARRSVVLNNLVAVGAVDRDTAQAAKREPIELAPGRPMAGPRSYFAEHVRRQLEEMLGTDEVWSGGYRVYTTLDSQLQAEAEAAVEAQMINIEQSLGRSKVRRADWRAEHAAELAADEDAVELTTVNDTLQTATPYLQGAFVAMDLDTGGIVAMVGGRSFEESKFNRITQAQRQPGSVFKPFVYTAAIRNGYPASYVVDDDSLSMETGDGETWTPGNFDGRFRGPVTLRRALTSSINVPTIRLLLDVGAQAVIDYARDAGISTPLPPYPALALGAAELIPLEVLRAYTIFPTGGVRISPISITRIEDRNGSVVRTFESPTTRVLTPQETFIVTSILTDVVDRGTGNWGVRGHSFQWPAGGKTGTTNDFTDAWFVGFTPEYVGLAWVGFDIKQTIRHNGTGGVLAAPIWTGVMKAAHEGLEIPEVGFPKPLGLEREWVTMETGMRAADFCGMPAYEEIFLPGTVPEHYCHSPDEGFDRELIEVEEDEAPLTEEGEREVDEDFLF